MRLIYSTEDKKLAHQFSTFLKSKGVENLFEIVTNTDWGSSDYGIYKCYVWVIEEEQMEQAQQWLQLFEQNPHQELFHADDRKPTLIIEPIEKTPQSAKRRALADEKKMGKVTLYVLIICALLFFIGQMTTPAYENASAELPPTPLYSPPINKILFYDYPKAYEIIDKLVKVYGLEKLQNLNSLPREGKVLLETYLHTPIWEGLYDKAIQYTKDHNPHAIFNEPMFEKIRQGEVWRLFTPCLLHANFFHIFFNMIWLVFLGKLIEERIGSIRYLLLIVLTAVFSNTSQYLMSGPNFLGYSGVICGMLAFVWARQRAAPWESYNLSPGVISFMFFFVMGMFAMQFTSFFLTVYEGTNYFPSIANTAHLTGGFAGYVLGRFNFMSMKG